MSSNEQPVVRVNVRALIEFVLRSGDLGGERDFMGPHRALAGVRGHQRLQRSRPAAYEKEVTVVTEVQCPGFILRVEGRIDGVLASEEQVLVEEIKTVLSGWDGEPDPLHWAQAKIYGHMLLATRAATNLVLQLTYLNLDSGEVTEFAEPATPADLTAFFVRTTQIYIEWVTEYRQRCRERDRSISQGRFPFRQYRPGQRELMVAVYKTVKRGARLFAEAPTGIGKTLSVLFPAVKALGEGRIEHIFYLTARGTGQTVATKAIRDLVQCGIALRAITLTAREKVCLQAGAPCDPLTCPFARGYYDRRKAAMRAALGHAELSRARLAEVAQAHSVCPFELSLDLSEWVDVVIGDYNYAFDPRVYLRRHFPESGANAVLLVDEAHNLVDRARSMYSAGIDGTELRAVQRAIRKSVPRCARALAKLVTQLKRMAGGPEASQEENDPSPPQADLFRPGMPPSQAAPAPGVGVGFELRDKVRALKDFPADLGPFLDEALKQAEMWLARNEPTEFREALLEAFFQLYSFRRTADLYGDNYVTLIRPELRVELFCLDASPQLRATLEKCTATVFFSATLSPLEYYRDVLGGATEDVLLQLGSPFPAEHLAVLVQDRIRTQFKDRLTTISEVAEAIAAVVSRRAGNYLVYLPSYEYLRNVQASFADRFPGLRQLVQRPGMTDQEREDFLAGFAADHDEPLVGWAVLGGVFGEAVDLVGDRLIGAVVVGVGLPQLSAERDLMREYFETRLGRGFDYAYAFPGMNRVLQAVGRVIRSEEDRGVVLLIDTRYVESRYRRLFPRWWNVLRTGSVRATAAAATEFWGTTGTRVTRMQ